MQTTGIFKRFSLKDDSGAAHQYEVIPHGAGAGWPLALKVLSILGPMVGKSMTGLTLDLDKVVKAAADIQQGAGEMFGGSSFNLGTLGYAAGELATALLADPHLVGQLFEHTQRDGQDLTNPAVFDTAYQANYFELMQALGKVVVLNFGPFLLKKLGNSPKLQTAMSTLQGPGQGPQTGT